MNLHRQRKVVPLQRRRRPMKGFFVPFRNETQHHLHLHRYLIFPSQTRAGASVSVLQSTHWLFTTTLLCYTPQSLPEPRISFIITETSLARVNRTSRTPSPPSNRSPSLLHRAVRPSVHNHPNPTSHHHQLLLRRSKQSRYII